MKKTSNGMVVKFSRLLDLKHKKKLKGFIDVIEIDNTLRIIKRNGHYEVMNFSTLCSPLLIEPHVSNVIHIHTGEEITNALHFKD